MAVVPPPGGYPDDMPEPTPTPPASGSESWAVSHREGDPHSQPTQSRVPAVIGIAVVALFVLTALGFLVARVVDLLT